MDSRTDLQILRSTDHNFGVNSYCILSNGHTIIIDPVLNDRLQTILSTFSVDRVLLSHEHYDHVCCVNRIREEYHFRVYCGRKAAEGLKNPSGNMSRYVHFLAEALPFGDGRVVQSCEYTCGFDGILEDNTYLRWQGHNLFIKETPGHSEGSICVLLNGQYLFSGDTIFKEYPTATRMPGGSTKAFKNITEPWLDSLPQDIMVYPGHTEPFMLSERYNTNHYRDSPVDDI